MTKKLGISLVASAMLIVAAANAETGSIKSLSDNDKQLVSVEKVLVTDVNLSAGKFIFIPNFNNPSTSTNPIFEYTYTDANISDQALENSLQDTVVAEVNATFNGTSLTATSVKEIVSGAPSVDHGVITYGQKDSSNVKAGKRYAIIYKDTNTSADLNISIAKGAVDSIERVGVRAVVYTGDSRTPLSDAQSLLFQKVKEYDVKLDHRLDARISLCDSRHTFTNINSACGIDNNVTDTIQFTITRAYADYEYVSDMNQSNITLGTDQNLTGVIASDANGTNGDIKIASVVPSATDRVANLVDADLIETAKNSLAWDLTVVGNTTIPTTKFNWTFNLVGSEGNVTAEYADTTPGSAGEWKPFGYYAQVPNVQNSAADGISTNIIVANTGTSSQPVIFTVIANNDSCVIDSQASITFGEIPAKSSMVYSAASLFAECEAKLGDITRATVQIDVPTTPEDISVFASWIRNLDTGKQFKDLPVYHTGTLAQ